VGIHVMSRERLISPTAIENTCRVVSPRTLAEWCPQEHLQGGVPENTCRVVRPRHRVRNSESEPLSSRRISDTVRSERRSLQIGGGSFPVHSKLGVGVGKTLTPNRGWFVPRSLQTGGGGGDTQLTAKSGGSSTIQHRVQDCQNRSMAVSRRSGSMVSNSSRACGGRNSSTPQ
jgi:hypothetical protein